MEAKNMILNKKTNIKDTIVLFGSPRSGTTWFMEILSTIPNYKYLFEPINPKFVPEAFKIGFQSKTYLPPESDWFEGEEFLRKIFSGQISSSVPFYKFKPGIFLKQLFGNKLIVKTIRLNRMLPWIVKRFQLRCNLYMIRHPCSVIASQLKTDIYGYQQDNPPYNGILPSVKRVLDEASKINNIDEAILRKIKNISTKEEILAIAWCLDNYIPLSSPKPHKWIIVTYEKAFTSQDEIYRIFNEINEPLSKKTIEKINIPSMLTKKEDSVIIKETDKQLSKWKKQLSEKQIKRILKIVSYFNLDFYSENVEPDYDHEFLK
jgi:hypothetical protein